MMLWIIELVSALVKDIHPKNKKVGEFTVKVAWLTNGNACFIKWDISNVCRARDV